MKFLFLIYFSLVLCCQNYCNGHGTCSAKDKCLCYIGWGGADCSQRACPSDEAFVDTQLGDLNHDGNVNNAAVITEWRPKYGPPENLETFVTMSRAHRYVECSNTGSCNHLTGECSCFDGYEGSACQRRQCPSLNEEVCSGHGYCLKSTLAIQSATEPTQYYGWETEKFQVCMCDKGWGDKDCSLRECPSGLDPVVFNDVGMGYKYTITNTGDSNLEKIASYSFKFTYDGVVYLTPTIKGRTTKTGYCTGTAPKIESAFASEYGEEIRRAIQTVPPLSQSTVTVTCSADKTMSVKINLEYADYDTFKVSEGTIESAGTDTGAEPGAVTRFEPQTTLNGPTITPTLCSSRGLCDTTSGLCKCFIGYYGASCENQVSIAL